MDKKQLQEIDFDGVKVKPTKSGVYRCPFKCGSPSYTQPTWKTEKGFRQHMGKCPKRPSFQKEKEQKEAIEQANFEPIKSKILASFPIKVGDTLPVIREVILKPTHEKRFNRMVRVRYEAEKRFDALEIVVDKIDIRPTTIADKDYIISNCLYINDQYRVSDVCTSLPAAKDRAAQRQKAYDDACEHASLCR